MPYGEPTLAWFYLDPTQEENSLRDSERSGRPSTSRTDKNVEEIRKIIKDDR